MTNQAIQMYALNLDQITQAIKANGHKRTMLVQGHMGTGKSSILNVLAQELPDHVPCYFDCTTKDLGDVMIPKMSEAEGKDYVAFALNEELGVHHGKPIILMIDEYGKANPAVKNALLRLMLERKTGGHTLHPDSIVFATTNLGAEGVGDLLPPHARNRIAVVTSRKPNNMEWIEWGINKISTTACSVGVKTIRNCSHLLMRSKTLMRTRTSSTQKRNVRHLSHLARWKPHRIG